MEFFYEPNPDPVELQRLENRLLRFNADIISGYGYDDFIHKAVAASGALAAAIHGQIGGGWLYVAGLWVAARHRGRGLGTQLLTMAESTAVAADCRGAYLYTYSFQAPDFYRKYGYAVFGRLENFAGDHAKLFMKKALRSGMRQPPPGRG